MALRPSSIPQHVVLPEPPASSLPHVPDPESDLARAASPTVTRLLATDVTDPNLESTAVFALVTELVDFAVMSPLDYVASLVIESEFVCPPSVWGELALSSDVLEDRQFELECLVAALPRFASMLLCPKGDPDALNIPTPRSYAEAITANKSGFTNRTKHIALRYFFVKDEIKKGRLELSYYPTSKMTADYFTKKLRKKKFEYCMLLTGQSHNINNEGNDTPEAKGSVGNI
ncbi:unnamed protein product [Closterium sp. NIES-53]